VPSRQGEPRLHSAESRQSSVNGLHIPRFGKMALTMNSPYHWFAGSILVRCRDRHIHVVWVRRARVVGQTTRPHEIASRGRGAKFRRSRFRDSLYRQYLTRCRTPPLQHRAPHQPRKSRVRRCSIQLSLCHRVLSLTLALLSSFAIGYALFA